MRRTNSENWPTVSSADGVRGNSSDFDFLVGSWTVRHRKLTERLTGSQDWAEFPGTLAVTPILAGVGNIDTNWLDDPTGGYDASSLRLFNASAGQWQIFWLDGRLAGLGNPVCGAF